MTAVVRAKPEVVNIKPARLTQEEAEQKKLQTEQLAEQKKKSDQQLKTQREAKAKERREVREEAGESLTAQTLACSFAQTLVLHCDTWRFNIYCDSLSWCFYLLQHNLLD